MFFGCERSFDPQNRQRFNPKRERNVKQILRAKAQKNIDLRQELVT